ncbi:MAG: MBL fold metallo-hydrolase [Paludibacteraceae bacterium]
MDRLRFRSLASGSSGNCYFIGNASYGILIDAGVGIRRIKHFLRTMGLDFRDIWGVFVTHDHTDHIKAVGVLGEKHNIPVYATQKIHNGINRNYRVTQKLGNSRRFVAVGEIVTIGDITVKSFSVSHDASESVGFQIGYKEKTFVVATDLGYIPDDVTPYLMSADYLVLETNYDDDMLANGTYPHYLKERIKRDTGHLSNRQAAEFLSTHFTKKWKYIFLCHLSKDNNLPEIAYNTITRHWTDNLPETEEKPILVPLERTTPSQLYVFD